MMMIAVSGILDAQTRRPARRPAPKPAPKAAAAKPVKSPADATCPSVLGTGVVTKLVFCDVAIGRDAALGIVIAVPPHRGPAMFTFDLHNRHTYSEEQVRARKAFARYTATVIVATSDGTILGRGVVRNEFRTAADLFDRVSGGAGPAGVKAIAPTGAQAIAIEIPEKVDSISIVGEKLTLENLEGQTVFTVAGRPIAIVSNMAFEYRPAPARRRR
jgi:hypothetical protein